MGGGGRDGERERERGDSAMAEEHTQRACGLRGAERRPVPPGYDPRPGEGGAGAARMQGLVRVRPAGLGAAGGCEPESGSRCSGQPAPAARWRTDRSGRQLGTWPKAGSAMRDRAAGGCGAGETRGLGGASEAEPIGPLAARRVEDPPEGHQKGQSGSPGPKEQGPRWPRSAAGVRRARLRPAGQRGKVGGRGPRGAGSAMPHCGAVSCPAEQSAASPASAH